METEMENTQDAHGQIEPLLRVIGLPPIKPVPGEGKAQRRRDSPVDKRHQGRKQDKRRTMGAKTKKKGGEKGEKK
jgi:hypothetical protein